MDISSGLSLLERQRYYFDPAIRQRMAEFFGAGAVFLAIGTDEQSLHRVPRPVEESTSWLDHGVELNRSLWDQDALIAHLDIEYVNFDDPNYPFV